MPSVKIPGSEKKLKADPAKTVETVKAVERTEYKLLKPLTQNRQKLKAGDAVMLRPDQVERLRANGTIQ